MCFFSIWKNICQKEELCNTSVDAVGFFAKFVILKSDVYLSRVPTAQVHYLLSRQAGAWVNSAHAPEICRPCVLKPLCHSAFQVPEQIPVCMQTASTKDICWCSKRLRIVQFQLHRSRDTLVLCGTHRETLCLFEFLCDNFTVHSFQYPTVPHLLQLYHMMQDLRGPMQRSVMQEVGWAGHEGHRFLSL